MRLVINTFFKFMSDTRLLFYFSSLKINSHETWKNALYFTPEALFFLRHSKELYNLKFRDVMKCLHRKGKIRSTE